jgi:cytochrome c
MTIARLLFCWVGFLGWVTPAFADEPITYAQGSKLMATYGCWSCHSGRKTAKGPSLQAIATKYASDPHARDVLESSILNGSVGVWGSTAMSPVAVPPGDLKSLVEWILALHP